MRTAVAVLPTMALLAACGGNVDPVITDIGVDQRLEWTMSTPVGSDGSTLRTPESEGYTVTLKLWSDGTVEAFRDAERIASATYSEREETSIQGEAIIHRSYEPALELFPFDGPLREHAILAQGKLILEFAPECCGTWVHTFVDPTVR